jgi:glutaredoxin-like YruB-family protein
MYALKRLVLLRIVSLWYNNTNMIKIYTTPTCPYCVMTKDFMKEQGVAFEEVDVLQDVKAREELVEKSGQLGVPVIDVDGKIVVGFNKAKLAELLGIKL